MFFLKNIVQIGKNKYRVILTKQKQASVPKIGLILQKSNFAQKSNVRLCCGKPFN